MFQHETCNNQHIICISTRRRHILNNYLLQLLLISYYKNVQMYNVHKTIDVVYLITINYYLL